MSEENGIRRKLSPDELTRLYFDRYTLEIDTQKRELQINAKSGRMDKGSVVFLKSIVLLINNWSNAERISTGDFSGCLTLAWPNGFNPLYRKRIETLRRAGNDGNIDLSIESLTVHFKDSGGYHDVRFDDASLDVEAVVCKSPVESEQQLGSKIFISRREFTDYGIEFLECWNPDVFHLDEKKLICMIKSKRGDFGFLESPVFYNVVVEISNWSDLQLNGWKVAEQKLGSILKGCCQCCFECCLFPFNLCKEKPAVKVMVDLENLNLKMGEMKRIGNFKVIENGGLSFDAVWEEVTVTYSCHNADWKASIEARSDSNFDYIDDFTSHSSNLFKSGRNSLNTPGLDDL